MIIKRLILSIFVSYLVLAHHSFADQKEVPRFVSIKFNEVNARTGPSIDCPIEWVFIKKGEPVKIVAEYENWRKIEDIEGDGGWTHSSVLSGKRYVIIVSNNLVPMFRIQNDDSTIIAKINDKIRCSLNKCQEEWCKISCEGYVGWVQRLFLWGVLPSEFRQDSK